MKKITVWYRFNFKNKKWEHNHIETGHINNEYPIGDKNQTKIWKNCKWKYEHRYLSINSEVI